MINNRIRLIKISFYFLLFLSLFIYISYTFYSYFGDNTIEDFKITNITDTGATLSWTTKDKQNFYVYYSSLPFFRLLPPSIRSQKALDERKTIYVDETKQSDGFYLHHITLEHLKPNQKYYFIVGSNHKLYTQSIDGEESFELETAKTQPEFKFPVPITGIVKDANNANLFSPVIIYLTAKNGTSESSPVSVLSNPSGGWALDVSMLYKKNLEDPFEIQDNTSFEIEIEGGAYGNTQTIINGYPENEIIITNLPGYTST